MFRKPVSDELRSHRRVKLLYNGVQNLTKNKFRGIYKNSCPGGRCGGWNLPEMPTGEGSVLFWGTTRPLLRTGGTFPRVNLGAAAQQRGIGGRARLPGPPEGGGGSTPPLRRTNPLFTASLKTRRETRTARGTNTAHGPNTAQASDSQQELPAAGGRSRMRTRGIQRRQREGPKRSKTNPKESPRDSRGRFMYSRPGFLEGNRSGV